MTLIAKIDEMRERASSQIALEEKRAESGRLQPLLYDAREMSGKLALEIEQLRLLQDQGVSVPQAVGVEGARKTLTRLRERFAKDRKSEQLTRGKDWTRLGEQVNAVCGSLSEALVTGWRQFVQSAFSGDNPRHLEQTLAGTTDNKRHLEEYSTAYAQLENYARSRPEERSDFERVRELSRSLTEIYQTFDFDVPEAVKTFLSGVADSGADLSLLTPEVKKWLEEQGSVSQYRIVARSNEQ